ncbi:hypothetical protein A5482_014915 (plasmid) [Cyanobacterium sp. IPPAS B-1200]|uniref:hypothetical protein n=1 Tax=Cyanobacterium sp. IPPAS B-1200 TaxID=1562720 RepID=UPI001914A04A|nr:hypothetical protein [Cyanobacterium sp. IPPAS B-1200]
MNNTKTQTKIIRQGEYIAEKLDNLRLALQNNDLKTASQLARIYHLTPVTLTA